MLRDKSINSNIIYSIYALKFFCAVAIIVIHTLLYGKIYLMPLCRLAVPIFFIISGFFLLNDKNELNANFIYSNLKKIIYITIISNAIYVIFYCFIGKYNHIQYMNTKWWIYEILTGWGICGHLWYLTAYIEVLICLIIVHKYKLYKLLYFSIPILLLLNVILGSYSIFGGIKNPYSALHTNFLVTGLPFVSIGMLIHKFQNVLIRKFKNYIIIICLMVAYFECIYVITHESYSRGIGDVFIFTPIAAIAIFVFCLKNKNFGKTIAWLGKGHSLFMYLYHNIVAFSIPLIVSLSSNYYKYESIVVTIITIILAILYSKIKKIIQYNVKK